MIKWLNNKLVAQSRRKRNLKYLRTSQKNTKVDLFHPATHDLYHWLLSLRWRYFLLLITLFYGSINVLFALAFLTTGNGIANAQSGSFKDAFFFSIQTLSTVGYGSMYPESLYAQLLVSFETWLGLLLLTILTGLMYARFSRPTAKVVFSDVMVICPHNGLLTLMFRTANRRENRILEAQVQVSLLKNEMSAEGYQLRRFYNLKLLRSQTPIFALSWLVMHPIDEDSPLHGETMTTLAQKNAEIWVALTGIDETFSQTIHARHGYTLSEVLPNHRFVDIFTHTPEGETYIDLSRFHEVISNSAE